MLRKSFADQHSKKNYRWIGNVNDIRAYNQRTSHPRSAFTLIKYTLSIPNLDCFDFRFLDLELESLLGNT